MDRVEGGEEYLSVPWRRMPARGSLDGDLALLEPKKRTMSLTDSSMGLIIIVSS